MAIGVYPKLSLAEARALHRQAHKLVSLDIDPLAEKQKAKDIAKEDANNTFEVIAREWHERKTPEWSKVNADTVIQRLEKDAFPRDWQTPY